MKDKLTEKGKEFRVDSWTKVAKIFDDWMSDMEFMHPDRVDRDSRIRYNALLYVFNQIKHWKIK